jgi:hypothetical protein
VADTVQLAIFLLRLENRGTSGMKAPRQVVRTIANFEQAVWSQQNELRLLREEKWMGDINYHTNGTLTASDS